MDRRYAFVALGAAAVAAMGFGLGGKSKPSGLPGDGDGASVRAPSRDEPAPAPETPRGPRFIADGDRLARVETDGATLSFAWEGARLAGFDVATGGRRVVARNQGSTSTIELASADGRVARIERDRARSLARVVTPAGRAWSSERTGPRTARLTGPFGTIDVELDAAERVVGWRDASGRSATFTRDGRGLVTRIEAGGEVETFAHDADGRVTREENGAGPIARTAPTVRVVREGAVVRLDTVAGRFAVERDGDGLRVTYPNGVVHERSVAGGRVARDAFTREGRAVLALENERDGLGRREVARRDGRETRYAYDGLGRLETFSSARGAVRWEHDADGAVTARVDSRGRTELALDGLGRLERAGADRFEHDGAGRLVARRRADGSVDRFDYDGFGRLDRVARAGKPEVRYGYDARGRVAKRTSGGVTTRFVYEGLHRVAELRPGHERRYVWGPGLDEPLAYVEDGRATFLHANELGHVLAYTDRDGKKIAEADLDPFGRILDAPGDRPVFFAGRIWDAEAGLYDLRARFYDPELGRFLTPDPAGLAGGFDPYGYCRANPVDAIDPLGLWDLRWNGLGIGDLHFDADSPAQSLFDLFTRTGVASAAGTKPSEGSRLRKSLATVEDFADEVDRHLASLTKGGTFPSIITRDFLFHAGNWLGFASASVNGALDMDDFVHDLGRGAVDLAHDELVSSGDRWAGKFEPKSQLAKTWLEKGGLAALESLDPRTPMKEGFVRAAAMYAGGRPVRAGVEFGKKDAPVLAQAALLVVGALELSELGPALEVPPAAPTEGFVGALEGEEAAGAVRPPIVEPTPTAPVEPVETPTAPEPVAETPTAPEPTATTESAADSPAAEAAEIPEEEGLPQDPKWGRRLKVVDEPRCFLAGTLVETSSGRRAIETLREGERVLAANDRARGARGLRPIVRVFTNVTDEVMDVSEETSSGENATLHCTPDHRFWVQHQGWTRARELRAGDRLIDTSGEPVRVRWVVARREHARTFNLEVAEHHTYFVAASETAPAVWVHNTCAEDFVKELDAGENVYLETSGRYRVGGKGSGKTLRLAAEDWKRIVRDHVRDADPAVDARNVANRAARGRRVTTQFTGTESQYMERLMKAAQNDATTTALREGRPFADVKFGGRTYRVELEPADGSIKGFYALESGGEFVKVRHP